MKASQLIFRELFGYLVNYRSPHEADRMYVGLQAVYNGPGRFYHNMDHIDEMVEYIWQHHAWRDEDIGGWGKPEIDKWACIAAAFWHDIYDPRDENAEELSAQICRNDINELVVYDYFGPINKVANEAARLINLTKGHVADDYLGQILIDADLLRFTGNTRKHSENIRLEYDDVPEHLYLAGRDQVLRKFLLREPFFYHEGRAMHQRAISNIIADLREMHT